MPQEVHQYRLPAEGQSTCADCPQAKYEGYDKLYRCCSYHPAVPNFLLGLALKDKVARAAVENLYYLGGLVPEGFLRTPHQWIDYLADLSDDKFGEAKRVRCPNINETNGFCNIYAFRNGVCSTFFCLNDNGDFGAKFWESLQEMVSQMEFALSQWALDQLGFNVKAYFSRLDKLAPKLKDVADPTTHFWTEKTRKYLWGRLYGKELQTFRDCGELISENRNRLWEIAAGWTIIDADRYDKAMNKMVPKEYQHEIDPDDLEPGENMSMQELLADVRRYYRRLWKVPGALELSPRARITKNPADCKESRDKASDRPYMLEFYSRRGGTSVEWREYLTKAQVDALRAFRTPRQVNEKLLRSRAFSTISDPSTFLAEAVGKRVLQPAH
ncbi:MAG: hypothetical protein KDD51_14305 [Bdellovibrionales bacterium]|nr:hypothetical protein [Bdellovibrionales bacterium]